MADGSTEVGAGGGGEGYCVITMAYHDQNPPRLGPPTCTRPRLRRVTGVGHANANAATLTPVVLSVPKPTIR